MDPATELLTSAREVLTPSWAWIREHNHKIDDQGRDCYCCFGSLLSGEVPHPGHDEAWKLLMDEAKALGYGSGSVEDGTYIGALTAFNEAPETTHEDVLALFDRAISKSQRKPSV